MPSSVTVTAKSGPAIQATAIVLTNATEVKFDLERGMLFVSQSSKPNINEFALSSVTAVTFSISGANYTITVS